MPLDHPIPHPGPPPEELIRPVRICGLYLKVGGKRDPGQVYELLAAQGVRCTGVEQSAGAVRLARRNVPHAKFVVGAVERTVQRLRPTDLVVLDPPRRGAGGKVCRAVAGSGARRVAYVACDPAALARDIGHLQHEGLRLVGLRAFDLFPMTHHVECVAVLER